MIDNIGRNIFATRIDDEELTIKFVINSNFDYEKVKAIMSIGYKKGVYAGNSYEDYVLHEAGHLMLYRDCKTTVEIRARDKELQGLYETLKGFSGLADKLASVEETASQAGEEALVESFVRMQKGEEIAPIQKVLIEQYFGGYLK